MADSSKWIATIPTPSLANIGKIDIATELLAPYHNLMVHFLSDIDLSSLMFNLIDNAINATKLCQRPFIKLHIEEKYHCLKVQIENSYDPKQMIEKKQGHGYGLRIIRDIVAAYHGDMTLKQEDGWFDVTIFLYEGESQ